MNKRYLYILLFIFGASSICYGQQFEVFRASPETPSTEDVLANIQHRQLSLNLRISREQASILQTFGGPSQSPTVANIEEAVGLLKELHDIVPAIKGMSGDPSRSELLIKQWILINKEIFRSCEQLFSRAIRSSTWDFENLILRFSFTDRIMGYFELRHQLQTDYGLIVGRFQKMKLGPHDQFLSLGIDVGTPFKILIDRILSARRESQAPSPLLGEILLYRRKLGSEDLPMPGMVQHLTQLLSLIVRSDRRRLLSFLALFRLDNEVYLHQRAEDWESLDAFHLNQILMRDFLILNDAQKTKQEKIEAFIRITKVKLYRIRRSDLPNVVPFTPETVPGQMEIGMVAKLRHAEWITSERILDTIVEDAVYEDMTWLPEVQHKTLEFLDAESLLSYADDHHLGPIDFETLAARAIDLFHRIHSVANQPRDFVTSILWSWVKQRRSDALKAEGNRLYDLHADRSPLVAPILKVDDGERAASKCLQALQNLVST